MATKAPLTDAVVIAMQKLVDDQIQRRDPSHSDIQRQINAAGLAHLDPCQQGQVVGKAKRVRGVLAAALEDAPDAGEQLVHGLVTCVRSCGGFHPSSPNYAGDAAIETLRAAFRQEGFILDSEGVLQTVVLDSLSGTALTDALQAYVRRAKRGVEDAALLTGTSKDLLEATAAHVLVTKYNHYPNHANFPGLLGQAFVALGFATPADNEQPNESPQRKMQRGLYQTACAINALRNKQGTGHGRPWLPTVTKAEAKVAVEIMGCIAELMLAAL
jgi:hypothetical protein